MTIRGNNTVALTALILAVLAAFSNSANSQADWPARPVSVIVGYPAGSATDAAARVVTGPLAKKLGQPVIIENRGGADGMIAGRAIARSEPNGYTMGFSTTTSWALALNMQPQQMGFDPRKEFASVSLLGDTHYLLIVNSRSWRELGRRPGGAGKALQAWLFELLLDWRRQHRPPRHVDHRKETRHRYDARAVQVHGTIDQSMWQAASSSFSSRRFPPRFHSCKPVKFVFWELPAIVGRR